MPLTDLVRLLNSRPEPDGAGKRFATPFVAADRGVVVHLAGLQLRSHFVPLVDTGSGIHHGHAATLRVTGMANGQPLDPAAVFVLPADDSEFVYLDRLVRTLHALNYLTQPLRGSLLLQVHQRHVVSVPANHGLAFEGLLRECGLLPTQVILEIDSEGLEDLDHFKRAITSYQSFGYGIAISRFGHATTDFDLLETIRPDIVKLSPTLFDGEHWPRQLIDRLHAIGTRVMVETLDLAVFRKESAASGIDLIQPFSPLSGMPEKAGAGRTCPEYGETEHGLEPRIRVHARLHEASARFNA